MGTNKVIWGFWVSSGRYICEKSLNSKREFECSGMKKKRMRVGPNCEPDRRTTGRSYQVNASTRLDPPPNTCDLHLPFILPFIVSFPLLPTWASPHWIQSDLYKTLTLNHGPTCKWACHLGLMYTYLKVVWYSQVRNHKKLNTHRPLSNQTSDRCASVFVVTCMAVACICKWLYQSAQKFFVR